MIRMALNREAISRSASSLHTSSILSTDSNRTAAINSLMARQQVFGEKQNRFVRFNAMQSILLYAALTAFYIILDVLATALAFSGLGILLLLFGLLIWLVGLGALALWIILMINAFQGKYLKLPIIGDYAEKFANPTPTM